jgi:hypothetical protein
MTEYSTAAQGSLRREDNTPYSNSNPGLESQPFGVAAGREGIAGALLELVPVLKRIADGIENQNRTVSQALPPEALSKEDAARFLGVDLATVEHLVRTRKLAYVQYGSQRGRVFRIEDLRSFLKEHRQPTGEEMASQKRRA